ncbi:MAG: hypothetical protein SH856_11960 [Flavobacteriales bacterium]|nr:hypothetical protein [Flavobacteriales bacterium]
MITRQRTDTLLVVISLPEELIGEKGAPIKHLEKRQIPGKPEFMENVRNSLFKGVAAKNPLPYDKFLNASKLAMHQKAMVVSMKLTEPLLLHPYKRYTWMD